MRVRHEAMRAPWVAHSVIAAEKTGEQLIVRFVNWAKGLLRNSQRRVAMRQTKPFLGYAYFDPIP